MFGFTWVFFVTATNHDFHFLTNAHIWNRRSHIIQVIRPWPWLTVILKQSWWLGDSPFSETRIYYIYMEVSWNRGTPKSSFLMVFSIINYPFGGTHPTSPRGVRLQEAIHTALPGISVILLCGPSLFVPAPWSPPGHGIQLSLDETNGDSSWVSSTVTSWSSWRIPMVQAREDFLKIIKIMGLKRRWLHWKMGKVWERSSPSRPLPYQHLKDNPKTGCA